MHFQKSESSSFNPWVVAVLWSLNYLAVSKAGVPTWIRSMDSINKQQYLDLCQLFYIYLQAIAVV